MKAILKITSPILIVIGFAMIASAGVSLWYHENPLPLFIGGGSAILCSGLLMYMTKNAATNDLSIKEGCVIATFSWILSCLFGALPFYTLHLVEPELIFNFTKSYYEAVSGFTTTGASIIADVEIIPRGILFWRSFMHWFGGMGIVVFAMAILPKLGIGGMQAFKMESPGPLKADRLVPRISETGKILYTVYLAITIIEVIALLIVGVSLYDALVHTFGTVGTGGFSTYNTSVAGLKNHAAEYIIAFFMWLSGVNFGLTYLLLWKRDWKSFVKDTELRTYTGITLIAILLIVTGLLVQHVHNLSVWDALRYAVFQVPTVLTTTGYATTDYNLWPVFPVIVLILLMFIGGSTGSTGGGIKVLRHIINAKVMKNELLKIANPSLVTTVKIGGRPIDHGIVTSVMGFTFIYIATFIVGAFILTLYGYDLVTAATASIANLGNIGPGLNSVGPAGNYSALPTIPLWVLIFEMLVGRLEVYTIFVLFIPSVWRRMARG